MSDFAAILNPWLSMRCMMLRRGNPSMSGPSPMDEHWAKELTTEALAVKVPELCQTCEDGVIDVSLPPHATPRMMECPDCPTIAKLLAIGAEVMREPLLTYLRVVSENGISV